jgi:hypothetical protein
MYKLPLTHYLFFFLAILFNALISFFIRGSTILYRPLTPLGRPWMPRLTPVALMTLTGGFLFLRAAAANNLEMVCALSFSDMPCEVR